MNRRLQKYLKWKKERNKRKKLQNAKKKLLSKVGSVPPHSLAIQTNAPTLVASPQSAENVPAMNRRLQKYLKWKKERNKRKKLQNAKKKLLSKVGSVPPHSPAIRTNAPTLVATTSNQTTHSNDVQKRITKATEECKSIDIYEQKDISSQKLYSEIPDTSGITTKFKTYASPKLSPNKRKSSQSLNESICDSNDVTCESNRIVTTGSSSKQMIQDSLQNKSLDNTNIKTPSQKSTPSDTSPGTSAHNDNYIMENVEYNYHYNKLLWNKETKRLKELCRKWIDVTLEKDIPDDAMYEIHQTLEQANFLINKKLERFRSLVEDYKIERKNTFRRKGEKLVTWRYLSGFWDMASMEVRDCDSRFEKLEKSRNRGWKEENLTAIKTKKMESKILNEEDMLLQDTNINVKDSTSPQNNRGSVIFDNNTDTQCSTRKSNSHDLTYKRKSTSTRCESSKTSLVQEVQFSNKKKIKSPYVAKKRSQMYKTPDVQFDHTISYINSDQTPGILKKSEEFVGKEIRVKSAHKVHFDDQVALNEVSLDEKMQTKLNLSAALSRIENLDLDELNPQEYINAERKLDFETEDFDSSDDVNEFSAQIQRLKEKPNEFKLSVQNIDSNARSLNDTILSISDKKSSPDGIKIISIEEFNIPIKILPARPLETNTETSITSETISNMTDMENHDSGIRILRSRTIMTNNTSKNGSKMMTPRRSVSKKENKTPVKSSRKSLLKSSQKDVNKYMTPNKGNIRQMENTILIEDVDKKRSSRKRVFAFSAETCVACAENKPVLPMTPHSKRNRSKTPS